MTFNDAQSQLKRFLHYGNEKRLYLSQSRCYVMNFKPSDVRSLAVMLKDSNGEKLISPFITKVMSDGYSAEPYASIYVLALCVTNDCVNTRLSAYKQLRKMSTLKSEYILIFTYYLSTLKQTVRFSKAWKRTIGKWIDMHTAMVLAAILLGSPGVMHWNFRRVLRMCHYPVSLSGDVGKQALWQYLFAGYESMFDKYGEIPEAQSVIEYVKDAHEILRSTNVSRTIELISKRNFTVNFVETSLLVNPEIWVALLRQMDLKGLIDSINRMSRLNVLGYGQVRKAIQKKFDEYASIERTDIDPTWICIVKREYERTVNVIYDCEYHNRLRENAADEDITRREFTPNVQILGYLDLYLSKSLLSFSPGSTGLKYLIGADSRATLRKKMCGFNRFVSIHEASVLISLCLIKAEPESNVKIVTLRKPPVNVVPIVPIDKDRETVASLERKIYPIDGIESVQNAYATTLCGFQIIDWAQRQNEVYDVIVLLCDNQFISTDLEAYLDIYRNTVSPNAKIYIMCRISGVNFDKSWSNIRKTVDKIMAGEDVESLEYNCAMLSVIDLCDLCFSPSGNYAKRLYNEMNAFLRNYVVKYLDLVIADDNTLSNYCTNWHNYVDRITKTDKLLNCLNQHYIFANTAGGVHHVVFKSKAGGEHRLDDNTPSTSANGGEQHLDDNNQITSANGDEDDAQAELLKIDALGQSGENETSPNTFVHHIRTPEQCVLVDTDSLSILKHVNFCVGYQIWKEFIIAPLEDNLTSSILNCIQEFRSGIYNSSPFVLRGVIKSFLRVESHKKDEHKFQLYKKLLELPLLNASKAFYKDRASNQIRSLGVADYIPWFSRYIVEERGRLKCILDSRVKTFSSTLKKLEACLIKIVIIDNITAIYVNMRSLEDYSKEKIYTDLRAIVDSIQSSQAFMGHVKTIVTKAVKCHLENDDHVKYSERLVRSYINYREIISGIYIGSKIHVKMFHDTFGQIMNHRRPQDEYPRCGEYLAKYCDYLLKSSSETMTETEIIQHLNTTAYLIKLLQDKDIFQIWYLQKLYTRLIEERKSSALEERMITQLSDMNGKFFVRDMIRMINNIPVSNELTQQFKDLYLKPIDVKLGMELFVYIASAQSWPLSQAQPGAFILPQQVMNGLNHLAKFYSNVNGRKIIFLDKFSYGDVKIDISGKSFTKKLCSYELAVLNVFDNTDSLDGRTCRDRTCLNKTRFHQAVALLLKKRLLLAENETVPERTVLTLNLSYDGTGVDDDDAASGQKETASSVNNRRELFVKATIIEILKNSKVLPEETLVNKVITKLEYLFVPPSDLMKECIEILIENNWIEQDSSDNYRYVACDT